jgi:FtsZ-interacting cell division protein YlmF
LAQGVWDRMLNFLGFEEVPADEAVEPSLGWKPSRDELARRRGAGRRPAAVRSAYAEPTFTGRAAVAPALGPATALRETPAPRASQVVVFAPRTFDDAQEVADQLRSGKPVILNLESTDRDVAQRVVNFVSGAVYALSGEMHRIGSGMLMFLPQGVEARLPVGLKLGGDR